MHVAVKVMSYQEDPCCEAKRGCCAGGSDSEPNPNLCLQQGLLQSVALNPGAALQTVCHCCAAGQFVQMVDALHMPMAHPGVKGGNER